MYVHIHIHLYSYNSVTIKRHCKCIIKILNLYIDGIVGPYASYVNSSLNCGLCCEDSQISQKLKFITINVFLCPNDLCENLTKHFSLKK